MPSFLDGILSEPVKLNASEISTYEPPHRPSAEKRTSYSSGVTESGIWQFTNGSPIEPLSNRKLTNSRLSIENSRNEVNHQTMMNGRSSGSSHSVERMDAKNESSHSLAQQIMLNLDGSSQSALKISTDLSRQTAIKPTALNDTPKRSIETSSSKTKLPEISTSLRSGMQQSTLSQSASSSPNRHRRAQSASNSLGRSNLSITSSEQPSSDTAIEPPNRFSSPPLYTSSEGKLASSSTPQHPGIARLQHRHTLQVPKAATGRGSREYSWTQGSGSEDAISSGISPAIGGARRGSLGLVRRTTRSLQSDLFFSEEIPQDGDVERWTENIKQKRISRRKRKEEEEDDRVIVGTKVDQHHVNWVTAYNMLTGIRFTVSRTNAKIDRDLTDADFDARHKFSFDITGNELTPSAKYDFKFKDYAPWVFRHLRSKFKLDPADYLISLTSKYILSELGSPGKSGSFFYFSRDYKYIIKTIHHAEHKLLRKILREYYAHVKQNPNTLISQFYGLHRVKIPYGKKIHFVVMNNLFPAHRDIHQTFDLKGSTVGRDFREEDLEANPRATLKDLNWLRRNYHLEFGPQKKTLFVEQMRRDVALLQKLKIMDYSLLVGIHDVNKGNEENLRDKTLQVFQPGVESGQDTASSLLLRTPSKLENARKARELRHIIKKEKPIPIDQTIDRMPEQLQGEKKDFLFYSDDGGIRATHEDGQPGEEIYYLGIIDCLTHVSEAIFTHRSKSYSRRIVRHTKKSRTLLERHVCQQITNLPHSPRRLRRPLRQVHHRHHHDERGGRPYRHR